MHDPDGDKWIVPADLRFLTYGWSCKKELVEDRVGKIPDPSPVNNPGDELNDQQFNTELNVYRIDPHRKENSITSQDPTASCKEYWASRRVFSKLAHTALVGPGTDMAR